VTPEEPGWICLVERIAAPSWTVAAGHDGFAFAPLIGLQLAAEIAAAADSDPSRGAASLWAVGSGA
jgi:hypothetical protein